MHRGACFEVSQGVSWAPSVAPGDQGLVLQGRLHRGLDSPHWGHIPPPLRVDRNLASGVAGLLREFRLMGRTAKVHMHLFQPRFQSPHLLSAGRGVPVRTPGASARPSLHRLLRKLQKYTDAPDSAVLALGTPRTQLEERASWRKKDGSGGPVRRLRTASGSIGTGAVRRQDSPAASWGTFRLTRPCRTRGFPPTRGAGRPPQG